MALDITNETWLPGWNHDGSNIQFYRSATPEMDVYDAANGTGDIRRVLYAICAQMYAHYNALPAVDKPAMMTIRKTNSFNADGNVKRTYTFEFVTAVTGEDVAAE